MIELLGQLDHALSLGRRVALARVIGVEGSSPRGPGAALMLDDAGEVFGSVSGGCVEGAVVTACTNVLDGAPPGVLSFGISDDLAGTVGLTCGGTIHVFVELLSWTQVYGELRTAVCSDTIAVLVTVAEGPEPGTRMLVRADAPLVGSIGAPRLDASVASDGLALTHTGEAVLRRYDRDGEPGDDVIAFLEPFLPIPRMIIFGAVDFAGALSRAAKLLGFRVTVCDARATFATNTRFPDADEVIVDWPGRYLSERLARPLTPRDAVCVLTHDPKFDLPAIIGALATDVGYIGAMGSRRTTAERDERLRQSGISDSDRARVMAPIGLDVGARTPAETAISICAELIRVRRGRTGSSLRDVDSPIQGPPS